MNIIKKVRNEVGMTQKEFADSVKIKQSIVAQYESNQKMPSIKTAKRIIELAKTHNFHYSLDDIYKDV